MNSHPEKGTGRQKVRISAVHLNGAETSTKYRFHERTGLRVRHQLGKGSIERDAAVEQERGIPGVEGPKHNLLVSHSLTSSSRNVASYSK